MKGRIVSHTREAKNNLDHLPQENKECAIANGKNRTIGLRRNKMSLRVIRLLLILSLLLLPGYSSFAEDIKCSRLPLLFGRILSNHYSMKTITREVRHQIIEQMVKHLDPSKTLFYESDMGKVKPVLQKVFIGMQSGDCASLKQVYDLMVLRARENESMVKKILGPDFRIDEAMELQFDVKKRPYAKNQEEKYALLSKFLQFQIENDLLEGIDLAESKKQQIHRYELQTSRVIQRTPEKLTTILAESFANALDPHTEYLSPDEFEDLRIHMKLSLEGIGALLKSINGFTVIEELIPGGGAERSGLLKPKDKIIAVAQKNEPPVNVIDMELRDVVKMIRGKKGTQVTLTILRQAERTVRFNITIVRDKIYMKDQEAKITYETRKLEGRSYRFGVIELPSFYGDTKENKSCFQDMKKLLEEARKQRVDGIVLDLSHNTGGLVDEAVRTAGLFIGKGGIVATKDSNDSVTILANGSTADITRNGMRKIITLPFDPSETLFTGPLVVLTSRMSASASEIVAGALQDYNRAVIIGADHTFGKGSVQELTPLPRDMGGIKITKALYFLPSGRSTQKTGVVADVLLPMPFSQEDIGETSLEYPLPPQSIVPFLGIKGEKTRSWTPVNKLKIAELAEKSKARIAKNAKFAEIIKDNQEAAQKNGIIRLADLRKEMKKNGLTGQDTPSELRQKAKEHFAPFTNESVNILFDMATMK